MTIGCFECKMSAFEWIKYSCALMPIYMLIVLYETVVCL